MNEIGWAARDKLQPPKDRVNAKPDKDRSGVVTRYMLTLFTKTNVSELFSSRYYICVTKCKPQVRITLVSLVEVLGILPFRSFPIALENGGGDGN